MRSLATSTALGSDAVPLDDVVTAWSMPENLAVSLTRIGSEFATETEAETSSDQRQAMLEALDAYLTPELLQQINDARTRLGRHVPDDQAEALSQHGIAYWHERRP